LRLYTECKTRRNKVKIFILTTYNWITFPFFLYTCSHVILYRWIGNYAWMNMISLQSKYRTEVSTMYPLYQFDMDQRLSLNYLVHHISYPLYLYCCNFCIMRLLFVYLLLFHINYYMSCFNVVHVHVRSWSTKCYNEN
jgi:hypothetical protein